jgi:hypothetical protein
VATILFLIVWCNLEQSVKARNQVGIGLSYRPARLHRLRLAESIPWNRFRNSLKVPSLNLSIRILYRYIEKQGRRLN